MKVKQVKFKDTQDDAIFGGILIDDRYLICGCCGGVADLTEDDWAVEILEQYDEWLNISEEIVGE